MNVRSISSRSGGNGLRQSREERSLSKHRFVCLGTLCIMGRNGDYQTATNRDKVVSLRHLINFHWQTNVASNTEDKVVFTTILKHLPFVVVSLAISLLVYERPRYVSKFHISLFPQLVVGHYTTSFAWCFKNLKSNRAEDFGGRSSLYANRKDNGCSRFVANLLR